MTRTVLAQAHWARRDLPAQQDTGAAVGAAKQLSSITPLAADLPPARSQGADAGQIATLIRPEA
jgi:hypothetical protein